MRITVSQGVFGYKMSDLRKCLDPDTFEEFRVWFLGRPALDLGNGDELVYLWDWDCFKNRREEKGKPVTNCCC